MKAAQKLYIKKGFEYIDGPMGKNNFQVEDVNTLNEYNSGDKKRSS